MNGTKTVCAVVVGVAAVCAVILTAQGKSDESKDVSTKTLETTVVTNDNGSVSRLLTECNVSTNGNMVTEHRRETRTMMDTDGNVLETSTSEYAQSYTVGQEVPRLALKLERTSPDKKAAPVAPMESFLGLKFGAEYASTNFMSDAEEPTLLRAKFTPEKALAGFDDYYVYVTPKTHKIVKVYAGAKKAIEPGVRGRRHYLVEALERRYNTWARLCSYRRPYYVFDVGNGCIVTACLAGAACDYETVIVGWNTKLLPLAADETEALREEARNAAAAKRNRQISEAAAAF